MEVVGLVSNKVYIVKISHTELEKFFNLYYGELEALKVGDTINLGKGYDFYHKTKEALNTTQEFINNNRKVIDTILDGINIMTRGQDK